MKNYTLILALFIGLIPASFASAEGSYLPEVATFSASAVTTSSATLEGSVNVWGEAGEFWFEYGKDQNNFTLQSSSEKTYSSADAVESKTLTDLSPNTTYYFRVVADNSFGQVKGAVKSFTTLPAKTTVATATVTPTPPATNSGSTATTPKSTTSASSTSTSTSNANSQTASAASAVTAGNGFLPDTFGGWLLVLVFIALIVVVARYIYVMREKEREEQMARMSEMRTA